MAANRTEQALARLADLTPRKIVAELDRYIIGQAEAKKAVAIALRNRWRRQRAPEVIRDEIAPNNIILIGPTGVGKTEIARRLAKLAGAPFIKVEASKFTEVGYVGRDVEGMVRDLVESAIDLVRNERAQDVEDLAQDRVEERLLDLLLPAPSELARTETPASPGAAKPGQAAEPVSDPVDRVFVASASGSVTAEHDAARERHKRTRDKLRQLLRDGQLDQREIEIEVAQRAIAPLDLGSQQGAPDAMANLGEMLSELLPSRKKRRTVTVADARRILLDEEFEKLVNQDEVVTDALDRVEKLGIVFLDEIDKIAGAKGEMGGPDVSREGVQRDLLPIVEGSAVQTKYGLVKTDHVLFVAAGAFHVSKPSDLIPELQGRFPIRVELKSLTEADFVRIMTEPENALTRQYAALLAAEGVTLEFGDEAIREIARMATQLNSRMENIGARRLHTVMTTLLEDVLYELPERGTAPVAVHAEMVRERLKAIADDEDLRKYIL
ncbi:MAG: ATP-dependent protease ATPase subunit HslU [Gemmatimonadaceae bacterium]|nr:ATP-dependent protease ATPase subunit HslU [Gemmatimonadaceae bacterium]